MNLPLTPLPIPTIYVVTEPWFEFPESLSKFPLAIYLTYGNVGIDEETVEAMRDFIFLGSKVSADGDCSHEIKICLLLERKP